MRPAAGCQNDVILPWSRDRISDSAFPSTGPVYEEAVKALPGLGGESRSGDANGQWQSVLAAVPNFVYNSALGPIGTTNPIQGVNPPKPAAASSPGTGEASNRTWNPSIGKSTPPSPISGARRASGRACPGWDSNPHAPRGGRV